MSLAAISAGIRASHAPLTPVVRGAGLAVMVFLGIFSNVVRATGPAGPAVGAASRRSAPGTTTSAHAFGPQQREGPRPHPRTNSGHGAAL